MRTFSPPKLLKYLYPGSLFELPDNNRKLYLTFDDGPVVGVTETIIDILSRRNVPATFFVTGKQVTDNPGLFSTLLKMGFSIGNHGYYHLNGFKTGRLEYINNAERGAELSGSDYFRPPYGKISLSQFRYLKDKYTIVFWSFMPYDYDPGLSASEILNILKNGIRPGSIIALHDNSRSRTPEILEEFIDYCFTKGYSFGHLS